MLQRWQVECLRKALALPGVVPVVVVRNGGASVARPVPGRRWSTVLYRRYRGRWMRTRAMDPVPWSSVLCDVPELVVTPERKGPVDIVRPEDVTRVMQHTPDVLLRFGFNILRGPVLEAPRFGVWSFHHGDEERYRGGPAGFWEVLRGEPVVGAVLQRLTERLDGGRILHKGWFATVPHSLSATVDTLLMGTAGWVARQCQRVLLEGAEAADGVVSRTEAPILKYPTNGVFLRFAWRSLRNKWRFHWRELMVQEEWNIGVLHRPIGTLLDKRTLADVEWMDLQRGTFRADPFGWKDDEGLHVLHELYDHGRARAVIHEQLHDAQGRISERPIRSPFRGHLSYPYILRHEERTYVVPESMADGRTVLMELVGDELHEVAVLVDAPLADPTLFRHEGRWWLFGTRPPLTNVELVAYHSADLSGPYVPHALDTLVSDIHGARPAGTPFLLMGQLIRPAQDSSLTYGGRMVFHRIERLTPGQYQETLVHTVDPDPRSRWNKGFHTVAAVASLTLVDGKRYVFVPSRMLGVFRRKCARIFAASGNKRKDA